MELPTILFEAGSKANMTFIDPEATWTYQKDDIASKAMNTPFTGRTMKGKVTGTLHKGILTGYA